MLTNRIIGAFTFRKGVYSEVEGDKSFTSTAWAIVAVVAFLSQLGRFAQSNILNWFISALIATVIAVLGFAVAAFIIDWVGRTFFKAQVTFDELVRTLGLAYVWQAVGLLGVFGLIGALACLLAPITILAFILGLVAWFVAAKEALDLNWGETIITVFIGWLAFILISVITGAILAVIGLTASAIGGAI